MEHLTTRPTPDLASHLIKFYNKDNNGKNRLNDNNNNNNNSNNNNNNIKSRIINGTSYYPPHPGPGFTSL